MSALTEPQFPPGFQSPGEMQGPQPLAPMQDHAQPLAPMQGPDDPRVVRPPARYEPPLIEMSSVEDPGSAVAQQPFPMPPHDTPQTPAFDAPGGGLNLSQPIQGNAGNSYLPQRTAPGPTVPPGVKPPAGQPVPTPPLPFADPMENAPPYDPIGQSGDLLSMNPPPIPRQDPYIPNSNDESVEGMSDLERMMYFRKLAQENVGVGDFSQRLDMYQPSAKDRGAYQDHATEWAGMDSKTFRNNLAGKYGLDIWDKDDTADIDMLVEQRLSRNKFHNKGISQQGYMPRLRMSTDMVREDRDNSPIYKGAQEQKTMAQDAFKRLNEQRNAQMMREKLEALRAFQLEGQAQEDFEDPGRRGIDGRVPLGGGIASTNRIFNNSGAIA